MTYSRYALVAIVLVAAACGGAVHGGGDSTGGGAAGGGGPAASGSGGTVNMGGAGSGTGGMPPMELCAIAVQGGCDNGVIKGIAGMFCMPFTVTCENGCSAHPAPVEQYSGFDMQIVDEHVRAAFCESAADAGGDAGGDANGGGGAVGTGGSTEMGGSTGTGGIGGTASVDAAADGPKCGVIRASDYNQSCKTAQDCTSVFQGDTCTATCACENATINKAALGQYHPIFVGTGYACPCPMLGLPSCVSGVCTFCPMSGCP